MSWTVVVMLSGTIWSSLADDTLWKCPNFHNLSVSCSCDFPHTLRCSGSQTALPLIAASLRPLTGARTISLLDCTIQGLEILTGPLFQGVSLHGLVISSGILKNISGNAFEGLKEPLEALGLPSNQLKTVPSAALQHLGALTRLDLTHNSLQSLHNYSFKGLSSLKFLDLSGNRIRTINNYSFVPLHQLKTLRLQSNNLKRDSISKFRGLMTLEELDLSINAIAGPLNSSFVPLLPKLLSLDLSHNQISSITRDALTKLPSLQSLSLKFNTIDVLEDHAFRALATLKSLDLAHNRIVAVSEASLAHLKDLKLLDLSHNFLRALTSDLISPLDNLQVLKLDDNDISMIAPNVMKTAKLQALTLSENPLNCDCSLVTFADWLVNSNLSKNDKSTAVCATPPFLENALVEELSPNQLVCELQDDLPVSDARHPMSVSGSRVTLQGFNYDGATMYFLWNIDTVGQHYCDSLFVYEELGAHEVLLERSRINCNYTNFADAHNLPITFEAPHLQKGHKYRYCIVLVERGGVEPSLVLGCSGVITLSEQVTPQVVFLKANMTPPNQLSIEAYVWPQITPCSITIHVFGSTKNVKQAMLNCSTPKLKVKGFNEMGPFKICVDISKSAPYCKWIQSDFREVNDKKDVVPIMVSFLIILLVISITYTTMRCLKSFFGRPKLHEQFFLPSPQNEPQHSRYVKLHATTKV